MNGWPIGTLAHKAINISIKSRVLNENHDLMSNKLSGGQVLQKSHQMLWS